MPYGIALIRKKETFMLRRFHFERNKDISGVSGCGIVAEGVLFDSGEAVVHWLGCHASINIYKSLDDCMFIHGHNGCTKVVFKD